MCEQGVLARSIVHRGANPERAQHAVPVFRSLTPAEAIQRCGADAVQPCNVFPVPVVLPSPDQPDDPAIGTYASSLATSFHEDALSWNGGSGGDGSAEALQP